MQMDYSAEVVLYWSTTCLSMLLIMLDHYSIQCFRKNKIATHYECARTKTAGIVNGALATEVSCLVMELVQKQPFTLCLDGSND